MRRHFAALALLLVFLFGGSTTFGYGLTDDETIAAAFERELQSADGRAVYNFTVPTAGDYMLSAMVNAPSSSENSL